MFLMSKAGGMCFLNEFMSSYNNLPYIYRQPNGDPFFSLPKRGDFVRLVRKYWNDVVHYDPESNLISLSFGREND